MNDLFGVLGKRCLIPVIVIEDAELATPVCEALLEVGLPVAEITFRTQAALASIQAISRALPEMHVGAGTVLSRQQAEQATQAGASFIVSPGYSREVVEWCRNNKAIVIPGCSNPTDMTNAINDGLDTVKFFPAESLGGLQTLRALASVFVNLRFVPTGGIGITNLREYLGFPKVVACGGSWMVKADFIESRNFEAIKSATRHALDMVAEVRGDY